MFPMGTEMDKAIKHIERKWKWNIERMIHDRVFYYTFQGEIQ